MLSLIPLGEHGRLQVLRRYCLLDTTPEYRFDTIVARAAKLFESPIALFTLVDESRQWFKSRIGLDVQETDRTVSFCAHVVATNVPLVVENATQHHLFTKNPLVVGHPRIAFYAGAPVCANSGEPLGALCVIDHYPRSFPWKDYLLLQGLARDIEVQLEARQVEREHAPNRAPH